jgi:hypothetical protein
MRIFIGHGMWFEGTETLAAKICGHLCSLGLDASYGRGITGLWG